jgi:hypothetical protein
MKEPLRRCETSGSDYVLTQCHTVGEWNPQYTAAKNSQKFNDIWEEAVMSVYKQACVDSSK